MFLFWIPALMEDEPAWIREILAAVLLLEGLNPSASEKEKQGYEYIRDFLASGLLNAQDPTKRGLGDLLDGLLRPMGLVKKSSPTYELHVNPRQSKLARHFLDLMGSQGVAPLNEIYWAFRKGKYGLLRPHFEILLLSLLFSGNLIAYRGAVRKSSQDLLQSGLQGITTVGRGEVLGEPFVRIISEHPFIPGKFKNVPITLPLQEDLWSELKARKPQALEDLQALKSRIRWASSFEALKKMPWEELEEAIKDLTAQWDEVKVSLSSREGLERFLNAARQEPFLNKRQLLLEVCRGVSASRGAGTFRLPVPHRSKTRDPGGKALRCSGRSLPGGTCLFQGGHTGDLRGEPE
jgi:hypothetical protein